MSYAVSMPSFTSEHRPSLLVSGGIHILLLFAVSSSLITVSKPMPQLAIEAIVVDESSLNRVSDDERRKAAAERAAEQRKVDEQQKAQEQQKVQEQQRKQQADADKQRIAAEQQRVAADKQRQDQAKIKQEQQQREAQQRADAERKQREATERAAAERQRMLAEAAREEQARRESELQSALREDQALLAARQSGEMSRYIALIQQKVERNWTKPPSAQAGLECEVAVVQLPNGDVVDARTVRCNGDDAVQRSIENAVRRSSPLPLPENRLLFDRNLSFIFTPE